MKVLGNGQMVRHLIINVLVAALKMHNQNLVVVFLLHGWIILGVNGLLIGIHIIRVIQLWLQLFANVPHGRKI
jgi:hypothetical protein